MNETLPKNAAYEMSVADRVARLHVSLKRQLGVYAKQTFDLTIVETRLLLLIAMSDSTTVNNLADRSDIDRTQISRSLSVLVDRDIVHKSPGLHDRREAVVKLTRKGSGIHDKILLELYRRNQALVAGLSKKTLHDFFAVMETLIIRARAATEETG
jgi:DNA-binding MarR family transcriptional regulator